MRNPPVRLIVVAVASLVASLLLVPASTPSQAKEGPAKAHIVRLADPPLASYAGGVAGLAPTKPAVLGATKLNPNSTASRRYLSHLATRQTQLVAAAEAAVGRSLQVAHRYRHAYNGLALTLTPAEADRVSRLPGVAQVQPAVTRHVLTDAGPQWIGAPAIWKGSASGQQPRTKGEGVVVGVIDTGINSDHPSFADVGGDGYNHNNPKGRFYGLCDPVTGLPRCNDKLIGIWDFSAGVAGEDDNGHGSHTASTAAGNALDAKIIAPTIKLERAVSGVAPHANIIAYKACLTAGSCLSPSLVASIDQATADGVDVINYSIGGTSSNPWNDADAQAFLGARDAGIFVAASAGNSGPGAATIGSPSDAPWLLSVGAATHNRAFVNSLTDMSGGASAAPADMRGKSFTSGFGPETIVYAGDYGDPLCGTPFPPTTFDGEIVICDRGVNARVEKGRNVKIGGAGGMVLANDEASGESLNADPHELPAVHITYSDGQELKAWVAEGEGHTGTIAGTTADLTRANGDVTASFSSRGPNPSVPGVLKPDITGPGVDVLAAYHTVGNTTQLNPLDPISFLGTPEFALISGTSMSSPHLAGSAALVRAARRTWTPAEVQSALMSTALDDVVRKENGTTPADPFDEGAGRVDLRSAARAGLLLHETTEAFEAANPEAGGDPTTLNLASLADAECAGTCSWDRVVRNGSGAKRTWRVSSGPGALSSRLTVTPSTFTLRAGQSAKVTVTADLSGEPIGQWRFGSVRFTASGVPTAHWPVAAAAAGAGGADASEVAIESDSPQGSTTRTSTSAVDVEDLQITVSGLRKGTLETYQIEQDPTPLDAYDTTVGTRTTLVDVPANSRLLAAELGDTTAQDLDLYVGLDANGNGQAEASEELCASATATAAESCTLPEPDGGSYWILTQNWLSGQVVDEVNLLASVVPGTDEGNLTVTADPTSFSAGQDFDLTYSWNVASLEPGEAWFGLVELGSGPGSVADVGSISVSLRHPD